jgi:hypothetical protein
MPDKSELYREVIDQILVQGKWYSDHIVKILKIIVDGDVTDGKIDNWVKKYSFDKEKQIKKITDNGIEYLFPEFLIKECTKNTVLNDGEKLANKTKNEILSIIFKDNKKDSNDTNYTQTKNRISKLQLNEYINSNITKEIFNSNECTDLRNLIKWI